MANAETIPNPLSAIHPFHTGAAYMSHAAEKIRVSFRDRTRASEALSDEFAIVEPLEILPATKDIPIVRTRQTATIRLPHTGHTHQLLITAPLSKEDQSGETLCTLPGITQNPSHGNANLAHQAFADAHPDMSTVSIHTDGIGTHDRLKFWQALHRPFTGMAQSRLDILQKLYGDNPVHLNGFSMATALVVKMANMNDESPHITLASKALISPAIVTPDKAKYVMGYEFLPYAYRTELEHAAARRLGAAAVVYRAIKELQLPCIGNALELGHGTEKSDFLQAANGAPLAIIHGSDDPLAQPDLYGEAAQQNPDNVHILEKPGKGHSISDPAYAKEIALDIQQFTRVGALPVRFSIEHAA